MDPSIDWALWRSFLAVAETGSLSAAARRLGLAQPTLGRHIDALEQAVGQALFLRAPQGMVPTAAACALVPEAGTMALAAASLARRAAAGGAVQGSVRIAASHVVGAEVLPRLLAPLLEDHPGLAIELALSNEPADLARHEADLAIRMVRPGQSGLVARRLTAVGLGLFAHRGYLERRGPPQSPADLAGHVLIGPDADRAALAGLAALGPGAGRAALRLRSDSDAARIAAVRAGLGIGPMQRAIAAREPDLVPVLPETVAWQLEAWLVLPEGLRALAPVRRVADHLAQALPRFYAGPRPRP